MSEQCAKLEGMLKGADVEEPLARALRAPAALDRARAAAAIGSLRLRGQAAALQPLLADSDPDVVRESALALAKLTKEVDPNVKFFLNSMTGDLTRKSSAEIITHANLAQHLEHGPFIQRQRDLSQPHLARLLQCPSEGNLAQVIGIGYQIAADHEVAGRGIDPGIGPVPAAFGK